MVGKLANIRKRKERVNQEYTQAFRQSILDLRRDNPMWTLNAIATMVGRSRERVRQILHEGGAPTAAVKELPLVVLTCTWCEKQFERSARAHQRNKEKGFGATYCGTKCQRKGLGAWQRAHGQTRTECGKGHPLPPFKRGPQKRSRRCTVCAAEHARTAYAKRKQETQKEVQPVSEPLPQSSIDSSTGFQWASTPGGDGLVGSVLLDDNANV
jgi:hypothetical protein